MKPDSQDRSLPDIVFHNQEDAVLYYIGEFGCITNLDATYFLNITRLSAKILNLRYSGYPIITDEMRSPHQSRYGNFSLFGAYRFARNEGEIQWYLKRYANKMNGTGKARWGLR